MSILRVLYVSRLNANRGLSLIELMVCLTLLVTFCGLAAPLWQPWITRLQIEATRDQLMHELQTARVQAMQLGSSLKLVRLQGCAWSSQASNDWSCGWQLSLKASKTVLQTSALDTPLTVTFGKSVPFEISPRGDLGTVGERWVIQSRQSAPLVAMTLCLNSASRVRWQAGDTCS